MYISKKYRVPLEEISCPGCGQIYGHHNTKVDLNSSECSTCVRYRNDKTDFVTAKEFIENILGYKPIFK